MMARGRGSESEDASTNPRGPKSRRIGAPQPGKSATGGAAAATPQATKRAAKNPDTSKSRRAPFTLKKVRVNVVVVVGTDDDTGEVEVGEFPPLIQEALEDRLADRGMSLTAVPTTLAVLAELCQAQYRDNGPDDGDESEATSQTSEANLEFEPFVLTGVPTLASAGENRASIVSYETALQTALCTEDNVFVLALYVSLPHNVCKADRGVAFLVNLIAELRRPFEDSDGKPCVHVKNDRLLLPAVVLEDEETTTIGFADLYDEDWIAEIILLLVHNEDVLAFFEECTRGHCTSSQGDDKPEPLWFFLQRRGARPFARKKDLTKDEREIAERYMEHADAAGLSPGGSGDVFPGSLVPTAAVEQTPRAKVPAKPPKKVKATPVEVFDAYRETRCHESGKGGKTVVVVVDVICPAVLRTDISLPTPLENTAVTVSSNNETVVKQIKVRAADIDKAGGIFDAIWKKIKLRVYDAAGTPKPVHEIFKKNCTPKLAEITSETQYVDGVLATNGRKNSKSGAVNEIVGENELCKFLVGAGHKTGRREDPAPVSLGLFLANAHGDADVVSVGFADSSDESEDPVVHANPRGDVLLLVTVENRKKSSANRHQSQDAFRGRAPLRDADDLSAVSTHCSAMILALLEADACPVSVLADDLRKVVSALAKAYEAKLGLLVDGEGQSGIEDLGKYILTPGDDDIERPDADFLSVAELKSKLLTHDVIGKRLRWCLAEDGEAQATPLVDLLRQGLAMSANGGALRASISLAPSGDSDAQQAPNIAGALVQMAASIAASANPSAASAPAPALVFPVDDWDVEINDDSFGHVLTLPTEAECDPDHEMYKSPTGWIINKLTEADYDIDVYGSFTSTSAVKAQCKRVGGKLKTYTIPNLAILRTRLESGHDPDAEAPSIILKTTGGAP